MHITFYDSFDDMMDDLAKAMEAADSRVQEWQAKIKKGDHFWRDTEYGFKVYGKVLENAYKEKHLQHYRFCRCYSEVCPEGEMGDVHVAVIGGLLTEEEFESARDNGWQ